MKALGYPLIDSHLHLQDERIAPHLPAVMQEAWEGGIRYFVCNGSSEKDWPAVQRLSQTQSGIIACFGLHPWYVSQRTGDWLSTLRSFLLSTPSGVGETGLDRWIEPRDEQAQEEVFRAQLALACELERPLMIHCLKAWEWLLKILKQQPYPAPGMLIHAYGGSKEFVKLLADLGAYFSFGGSLLREGKEKTREALRFVPRDRLLFETDAPDILPPRRFCVRELRDAEGRQINEPANLVPIITQAAALLEIPVDQLAAQSLNNARQFFGPLLGAPMHV